MSGTLKPSVLILGGCGFIGSHVVDRFVAGGHAVRVLDPRPEAYRPPVPGVDYRYETLANPAAVAAACADRDLVIHLVSTTIPKTSNDDPIFDVQSNLVGTLSCLRQCVAARVRKVVFLSSGGAVYGNPSACPVPEDAPTQPACSYGIVKLAIEKYLALFELLHGLDYAILRAANAFGPRQNPLTGLGVVSAMLARIALGRPIEIWGDGRVVRDFLVVDDLAEAVYAAALQPTPARLYNIGAGVGLSLLDVLARLEAVLGRPLEVKFLPGRAFDVQRIHLDITRAREQLGWVPQVGFDAGVRQTWEFVRQAVGWAGAPTPALPLTLPPPGSQRE
jgi:UDP-glucose 4-epimerase